MSARSKIVAALVASAAPLVLVGLNVVQGLTPSTAHAACSGGMCVALLNPKVGQCAALLATGGEPPGDQTVSVATRTARAMVGLRTTPSPVPAITTWHAFSAAGTTDGCGVSVLLTMVQAAALRDVIDATGVGSIVVDPRLSTAPAWAKSGAARAYAFAGFSPTVDSHDDPDAGTGSDGGP